VVAEIHELIPDQNQITDNDEPDHDQGDDGRQPPEQTNQADMLFMTFMSPAHGVSLP
jgi:hypothetical protein